MTKTYLIAIILTVSTLTFAVGGEALAAKDYRLVKTANDAKVYLVDNNRRVHIPNPSVFEAGGYKWGDIKTVSQKEMDIISNTALIKSPVDAKVYIIKDGAKQWIPDEKTFLDSGLKWSDIVVISQPQVNFYDETKFSSESISEIAKPEIKNEPVTSEKIVQKQTNNYVKPTKEEVIEVENLRPESPYTAALGINNNGDAVGYSMKTGSDNSHPFLFKDGIMKDIGNGYSGIAYAVNENDQIVGQLQISYNSANGGSVNRAFLWENGKITKLGGSPGVALDINNSKQAVGYMFIGETDGFPVHAYLWEKGKTKDLGTLGGNDNEGTTRANAINESGQIVGCSIAKDGFQHPFLWENGVMRDLGNVYNLGGCAVDVNDSGQVLGYFYKKNEKFDSTGIEAFLWENGNMTPFVDAPVGFWPYKINNNGDIAGSQNGVLIRRNGAYRQYNIVSDWLVNASNGIGFNDNGQIAVMGSKPESGGGYGLIISLPDNMPPVLQNLNANVETVCAVEGGECLSTKVILTWEDEEADNNADISFYYYEDRRGSSIDLDKPGVLIVDKIKEDNKNEFVWDIGDSDVVSKGGTYAIYAVIDDGVNAPKKVYSKQMLAKIGWWDFCNAKNEGKTTYVRYDEDEQKIMGGC